MQNINGWMSGTSGFYFNRAPLETDTILHRQVSSAEQISTVNYLGKFPVDLVSSLTAVSDGGNNTQHMSIESGGVTLAVNSTGADGIEDGRVITDFDLDLVGLDRAFDGTVSGGVTIDDGAIVFDGTSSYLRNTDSGLNIIGDLNIFYKGTFSNLSTPRFIVNKCQTSGVINNPYDTFIIGGQVRIVRANASGFQSRTSSFASPIVAGVEYNISISVSSAGVVFGLNGVYNTQPAFTLTPTTTLSPFNFGTRNDGFSVFVGELKNLYLHNRALSDSENTTLYSGGTITDGLVLSYSGLNYIGTPTAPTTIINGPEYIVSSGVELDRTLDGTVSGGVTIDDGAIVFDGVSGSYLTVIPGTSNKDVQTVIAKVIFNQTGNYGVSGYSSRGNFGLSGTTARFEAQGSGGRRYFTGTVPIGEEVFVGYRINNYLDATPRVSGDVDMILNGVIGNDTEAGIGVNNDLTTQLYVGSLNTTLQNLDGKVISYKLYNRALSNAEITTLYNGGTITDGLVLSYSGRNYSGTPTAPTSIHNFLPTGQLPQLQPGDNTVTTRSDQTQAGTASHDFDALVNGTV